MYIQRYGTPRDVMTRYGGIWLCRGMKLSLYGLPLTPIPDTSILQTILVDPLAIY